MDTLSPQPTKTTHLSSFGVALACCGQQAERTMKVSRYMSVPRALDTPSLSTLAEPVDLEGTLLFHHHARSHRRTSVPIKMQR